MERRSPGQAAARSGLPGSPAAARSLRPGSANRSHEPLSGWLGRLDRASSAWLLQAEPNAAGRLGLYRVLYALFYLWLLSDYTPGNLAELPGPLRSPVLLNHWLPAELPPVFFEGLAAVLVGALVLLLVGCFTRAATLVVGAAGSLLESFFVSADFEHSTIFVFAYIPFFMLFFGDWGGTWSLDALRARRRGAPPVDPAQSDARFVLPIHATLVVLAALFVSAGVHKLLPGSNWFAQENLFGNLMVSRRVVSAMRGLPQNPVASLFVQHPSLDVLLRWFVVAFESSFFLALVSRRLRSFYLSLALIFHSINAIWMLVTFTPILIVYALFVDWQAGLARLRSSWEPRAGISSFASSALAVTAAVGVALLWSRTQGVQQVLTVGGWIDWHTIWYPVLPLATLWWVDSVRRLLLRSA